MMCYSKNGLNYEILLLHMERLKLFLNITSTILIFVCIYVSLHEKHESDKRELELMIENNQLRMKVLDLTLQKDTIRTYVYRTDTIVRYIKVK